MKNSTNKPLTVNHSKAFEILVREHHKPLLAYALSLVRDVNAAEDIVQESFITAFKKLDSFDEKRKFASWMRGIIRNKYFEYCRKHQEIPMEHEVLESLNTTHDCWDMYAADQLDVFYVLKKCMKRLPEVMFKAIDFFYFKGVSGLSIAKRMNCSDATVRKRLERARSKLGGCINESIEKLENVVEG